MKLLKNRVIGTLFILILTLPAAKALFRSGFFPSQDGEWMVIRLSAFHQELVSGQFPVRFASRLNHGYGYPVFNFLYPLPFYLGEFFYLFLGSFQNAVKAVFILSFLASGVFMYLWMRGKAGDLGGIASSFVYVYTPYRFLDVYVRGSIGEATAFIFPPIIFWAIDKIRKGERTGLSIMIGSFAYSALVTSHNVMGLLFTPLFFFYFLFLLFSQKKTRKLHITYYILHITFSLSLSCFFWLPALLEKKYVYFDKVLVSNFFLHSPSLRQLIMPRWGFGPSILGGADLMSFQTGLVNLTVFFLWLALIAGYILKKIEFDSDKFETGVFFSLVFTASFFLMLRPFHFFWKYFPIDNLIQFPWRLLALTCFSSSVLAGFLISVFSGKLKIIIVLILVASAVFFNLPYTKPEYFVNRGEGFYTTNEGTTTVANEYLPIWVKKPPFQRAKEKVEIVSGEGEIKNLSLGFKKIKFGIEAKTPSKIRINTVYFPGWKVFADGKEKEIDYKENNGLIVFTLDAGKHQVEVVFGETPLRLFADLVSGVSLLVVVVTIVWSKIRIPNIKLPISNEMSNVK